MTVKGCCIPENGHLLRDISRQSFRNDPRYIQTSPGNLRLFHALPAQSYRLNWYTSKPARTDYSASDCLYWSSIKCNSLVLAPCCSVPHQNERYWPSLSMTALEIQLSARCSFSGGGAGSGRHIKCAPSDSGPRGPVAGRLVMDWTIAGRTAAFQHSDRRRCLRRAVSRAGQGPEERRPSGGHFRHVTSPLPTGWEVAR